MLPLPRYTERKWLPGSGVWAYYFHPPSWARAVDPQKDDRGPCPVGAEELGTDYAKAVDRAENVLLKAFDSWRTRGISDLVPAQARKGTLDWLFAEYRNDDRFKKLGKKVRKLHDDGFALVGNHVLKDGRRLGTVNVTSIDTGVADTLYQKLLPKRDDDGNPIPLLKDGEPVLTNDGESVFEERRTTANHAMKSCRRAWNIAMRLHPTDVPNINPFANMGLVGSDGEVMAASYPELLAAVAQADAMGMASLGTALMLTWEWLQREEHIFTAFKLEHYRPRSHPDEAYIVHPKNGEAVWIPLFDGRGANPVPLFPELMARMDALRRDRIGGGLFFMRDWIDRSAGAPVPWATASGDLRTMRKKTRAVLLAAELDPGLSFTSFRHGGLTECGDSDLTDAQIRAISRHKTAKVLPRYVKRTQTQIMDGTHKRRAGRPSPSLADELAAQLDLFGGVRK